MTPDETPDRNEAARRAAMRDAGREGVAEAAAVLAHWAGAITRAGWLEGGPGSLLLSTAPQVEVRIRLLPVGQRVTLVVLDEGGEPVADVRTVEIE